jgi:hypothetical protein
MKCAYCLEEMNDGATVCRVCRRTQPRPLTKGQRTLLLSVGGILLLATAGVGAYYYFTLPPYDPEIASFSRCVTAKGIPHFSESSVREQLDALASVDHKSREYNLNILRRTMDCS